MKKITILMGMAFAGLSASAMAFSPTNGVKAEGEASEEISVSSPEEVLQSSTGETAVEPEQELKDKIDELEKQLAAKISEFQKTRTYTIVLDCVVVIYTLWGVIDKLLSKAREKGILDNSNKINEGAVKVDGSLAELKALAEKLSEQYGDSKIDMASLNIEIVNAIDALKEATEQNKELKEKYELLEKAFLELCKNDEELVKSGAYKKVLDTINGVAEDGE